MGELLTFGSGLLAGAGASFCAACFLFLYLRRHSRKKMEKTYQQLLTRLDRAMGGQIQETAYDESMDAAVTERLNRVVRISRMHQEKAERERDTIKSLISDISHQVRTPLSGIMLYAGLLHEQALDADTALLADKIGKQSEKLDFFMKELVKSSYAERELIALHPQMTCVEEIMNTACQMAELSALKKDIDIVKDETDAVCYADKKWTIEALYNVLDNAVKYSPEHSQVTVRVIVYETFACIQVQDEGIGISEEEQGLVFERFYRSKAVSSRPGFGIGLYLVREVLAKQGGYAKVKSEAGKGTVMQLYMSRHPMAFQLDRLP